MVAAAILRDKFLAPRLLFGTFEDTARGRKYVGLP